ncbi:MAG: hypothetical protein HY266_09400 [Deltaproteobacteria bacterium]|nr:hypothetical protein [Deltaproteobacteria bacterium]
MEDKEEIKPKRGVGLRVFGSVLFFLGMINIMFSLKAGIEISEFYIYMMGGGIIFFAIGLWRNRVSLSDKGEEPRPQGGAS